MAKEIVVFKEMDSKFYITYQEWLKNYALEVELPRDDMFLIIMNTLTRMGITSGNRLYQSCNILHKKGKYYICHFKEMFALDNRPVNLSKTDIMRRNTIAKLLEEWELLTIVNPDMVKDSLPVNAIKIISNSDTSWERVPMYVFGRNKKYNKGEYH